MLMLCVTVASVLGYLLSVPLIYPLMVRVGVRMQWFDEELRWDADRVFSWVTAWIWPLTFLWIVLRTLGLLVGRAFSGLARRFVAISTWPRLLERRRRARTFPKAEVVRR